MTDLSMGQYDYMYDSCVGKCVLSLQLLEHDYEDEWIVYEMCGARMQCYAVPSPSLLCSPLPRSSSTGLSTAIHAHLHRLRECQVHVHGEVKRRDTRCYCSTRISLTACVRVRFKARTLVPWPCKDSDWPLDLDESAFVPVSIGERPPSYSWKEHAATLHDFNRLVSLEVQQATLAGLALSQQGARRNLLPTRHLPSIQCASTEAAQIDVAKCLKRAYDINALLSGDEAQRAEAAKAFTALRKNVGEGTHT